MTDAASLRRSFATLTGSIAVAAVAAAISFGAAPASAQMYGTYADGVFNDNQQLWSALGATIGGSPWNRARLAFTGGGVVAGNANSPNGWLLRLQFQQTW